MNKLLLLVLSILTIGLIGCDRDNPVSAQDSLYNYVPDSPTPDNIPNLARMNYPVEEFIVNKCLNYDESTIENALHHVKGLKEQDSLWKVSLSNLEQEKKLRFSKIDKNNPDYKFMIEAIQYQFEIAKQNINEHYFMWTKFISYNLYLILSSPIPHEDWKRKQMLMYWIWDQTKPKCD